MKQAILNLKKKLLIVELPEGATDVHINDLVYKNKVSFRTNTSLHLIETKENLLGEYPKLIGKLTDITEDQLKDFVEGNNGGYDDTMFMDYKLPKTNFAPFQLTAKESFFSYLEAQGIYFENPLGEKPILNEDNLWGNAEQDTQVFAALNYQIDKWQEAEEKVWKLENLFLFEIL